MIAITEFATRDALMQAAAARIVDALRQGISKRGEACAALSGGSTPEPAYRMLAAANLEWPRVTFALVDERFVPADDLASNEAMLRRALAPALSGGATLLPMFSGGVSLEDAADAADAFYARRAIDIAVMGMGEDGHTASWFSQSPQLAQALGQNARTVVGVHARGAAGSAERLTLTKAAVVQAQAVLLLITGDAKRQRLEGDHDAPVRALFERPVDVLWAP